MNKYWFFILIFFYFPVLGSSDFNELGKNPEVLESSFDFSSSSLQVVQKRWLPRRFLSELSLGFSPVLKGFNYMNNYSVDMAYRFFLDEQWSIDLKYSWYFNPITLEGDDEVKKKGRIPLELRYPQKQAFFGGVSWYPFYGKAVFYNHLIRFDLYLSVLGGMMDILHLDKNFPTGSLGIGLVCWWHKNLNTRLEALGTYYKYEFSNKDKMASNKEYFYKIYISTGVLF